MREGTIFALACGLACGCGSAATAQMTADQIGAVERVEAVTIPVPGEFFVAISKASQPAWGQNLAMSPIPTTDSRSQIALLLGLLVADGYIAVEAHDGQTVKNVGREIIAQAKKLNVGQSVLGRSNSITDFADNNDWNAIREELEATQNEVKLEMAEQKDDRLVSLVTLGAWLRGMEIASRMVEEDYQEGTAKLLRQPAIVEYLIAQIDALPESERTAPLVLRIRGALTESLDLVRDPIPSKDQINKLHALTDSLCAAISGREPQS